MTKTNHFDCIGYNVFEKTLEHLPLGEKTVINTINQYSFCIAEKDLTFKKALQQSDVLLPDGIGIVIAAKFLYKKKIKKIAGADIHHFLLEKLNREKGSCFYLGSSKAALSKIKERITTEFPNISIETYSPPYKSTFSEVDTATMISEVNNFKPDVLFVGMTAPKQEKWSHHNNEKLECQIICSIGAVFDFYAGTIKRPHNFWISIGLEWFIRLFKEPKRMWRRYIYYGVIFMRYLIKEKLKLIKSAKIKITS